MTPRAALTKHLLDGDDSVINYIDGKRCLVNQEVLGITGAAAWQQAPADRRQVLSAGDSVTDITFLGNNFHVATVTARGEAQGGGRRGGEGEGADGPCLAPDAGRLAKRARPY